MNGETWEDGGREGRGLRGIDGCLEGAGLGDEDSICGRGRGKELGEGHDPIGVRRETGRGKLYQEDETRNQGNSSGLPRSAQG